MQIRLTRSHLDCQVGERLPLGVFTNLNGQSHLPNVVMAKIHYWATKGSEVTLAFSIPEEEPRSVWVGTADRATRNGTVEQICDVINIRHDAGSLTILGKNGAVLAQVGGSKNGNGY